MTIHIHIHRPTRDAGWDEGKHPRKEDGKFGSGGSGTPVERRPSGTTVPHGAKPVSGGSNGGSGTVVNHQPSGTAVQHQAKGAAPAAPDHLTGPKSKAAIAQIKALAAKGDWRGIANVQTMGTHPQVTAYRDQMADHLQAGGKALTEALGGPAKSTKTPVNTPEQIKELEEARKKDLAMSSWDVHGDGSKIQVRVTNKHQMAAFAKALGRQPNGESASINVNKEEAKKLRDAGLLK